MALSYPGFLKSTKFLCKYVQINPPSAVVCYIHSHLAVQPCKDPLLCFLDYHKKIRKYEEKTKQAVFVKDKECNTVSTILCPVAREGNSVVQEISTISGNAIPGSFGGIESAAVVNTAAFYKERISNSSLLEKWNADPLMDKKQFVLMVFKSDNFMGRLSFEQENNVKDFYSPKTKPLSKMRVSRKKYGQTCLEKGTDSLKEPLEVRYHKEMESIALTAALSSNSYHVNSISEAATFYTNLYSDTGKPKTGNVIRNGPDATQLSSVLLVLREEIPEFFLKKPNYGMYHKKIKFVNNISRTTTHGIYAYRAQISGARRLLLSFMTDLTVEVLKITKHADEGAIKVRWRIKGVPLVRRLVPFIGRKGFKNEAEAYRYLDGFSVFEIGNDGLIHSHELHKVMPSPSKEKDNPLWMLSYVALLRLLNPRPSESVGVFECWSTIEGVDSMQGSDALPC